MRQMSPCQIQGGGGQGRGQRCIRGASHRNENLALPLWLVTYTHTHTQCLYTLAEAPVYVNACNHAFGWVVAVAPCVHIRLRVCVWH